MESFLAPSLKCVYSRLAEGRGAGHWKCRKPLQEQVLCVSQGFSSTVAQAGLVTRDGNEEEERVCVKRLSHLCLVHARDKPWAAREGP